MFRTDDERLTRRRLFHLGLAFGSWGLASRLTRHASAQTMNAPQTSPQSASALPAVLPGLPSDVAINATTAMLFSAQAPLVPEAGLHDSQAVWTHVPEHVEKSVLIYLHGNNNYVTVDATGKSRVPDWATTDEARQGAAAKLAAPLSYKLDQLATRHRPLVLVPEAATLSTKSFWAREPAGQYAKAAQLGSLISDCKAHLSALKRPDGKPYLARKLARAKPTRVTVSGHSGAGLPLEEAAVSSILLPTEAVGADLWLLDSTYWSKVDGFVAFCQQWHDAKRLGGQKYDSARFVCIYRGKTQTEEIADSLRAEIAKLLGVSAESLLHEHTKENVETQIRPALQTGGVVFVRTQVEHDIIPTFFIPLLLDTAAS